MKKSILVVFLAICSLAVFAQADNKDTDKKLRFGFNLGTNYSLHHSEESLSDY